MYEAVADGGAIYLCTRFDVAPIWQQALTDTGAILKTPIVWDKGNCPPRERAALRGSRRSIKSLF